jgi:hypothetical protein
LLGIIPSLALFEVAHLDESVFFAAPEEPAMNSYGLRPYKPPIFLLIFLNGSNCSVSLDFGKTTIQKAQVQSLRFGLAS